MKCLSVRTLSLIKKSRRRRRRRTPYLHVQRKSKPIRLATPCQSHTATQSPCSISAHTSSRSSATRSQFRRPVYPRTALIAVRTRSRCDTSKHAVPITMQGMSKSVCTGSEGLKDSSISNDSFTAKVIRRSSCAGRRAGGGDEARGPSCVCVDMD